MNNILRTKILLKEDSPEKWNVQKPESLYDKITSRQIDPVYIKQHPYIDDNGIWMPIGYYAPQGTSNHRLVMSKEMFVEAYNKWIKGE